MLGSLVFSFDIPSRTGARVPAGASAVDNGIWRGAGAGAPSGQPVDAI